MDNLQIHLLTRDTLTEDLFSWFLDTYFRAVEEEIQKGAAKSWRRVDRTQEDHLKKVLENLLSQKNQTCLYVAFIAEKPVGYFLGLVKECVAEIPSKTGYINGLYVESLWRRQGIASQLYQQGLSWFQERNIFHYELYVSAGSQEGQGFWKSKGFEISEQVMNLSLKTLKK